METDSKAKVSITDDETLRELLRCLAVPCVPSGLDTRIITSYDVVMSELHAKAKEANMNLRKTIVLSLVRVFAGTVFFVALMILLMGFGWVQLPSEVIHVLLASTIAQAVVLYKAVITNVFAPEEQTKLTPLAR